MAYGKDNFIDFADLDLNLLLGDFTESEYDISDSDSECVNKSKKSNSSANDKLYKCDECSKSYASISGIRGHLRSKHGKQNIKGETWNITSRQHV